MDTKSAVNKSAVVRLHKLKPHTKALEICVNNYYSLQMFLQSYWIIIINQTLRTKQALKFEILRQVDIRIRTRNHVSLTVSAQNKSFLSLSIDGGIKFTR